MMHDIMKTLIEMAVYSSAMIVAVMALSRLFSDKLSTKIIHALWIIALIRLLLPVTLESPYRLPFPASLIEQEQPAAAVSPTPAGDISFIGENMDIGYISEPANDNGTLNPTNEQISVPKAGKSLDIWTIVFAIWLIGALSYLAHNLYRILTYNKKIKNIVSTDFRYRNKLESTKKRLDIRRNIIIAESKYADIPFVYGYLRPKVLFPLGFFNAVDDEKLSYIVLHELTHIKRRDVAVNYIWMAAKAIHWFNPLIHLAYKAYKNAVEECCDEAVSELLDNKGRCEYTQSLIDTMRFSKKRYYTPLSVSFVGKETAIRKRVIKMMYPQKKSRAILYITVLLASIMVLACFTTACQPAEAAQEDTQTASLDETQENAVNETEPTATPVPDQVTNSQGLVEPLPTPIVGQQPATYDTEMTVGEAKEIIDSLGLSNAESVEFIQREDHQGNSMAFFMCRDGEFTSGYTFVEYDRSLAAYENKAVDMEVSIQKSDAEFEAIALEYAKKIWGYEDIQFTNCEASALGPDGDFPYFGANGIISATGRAFEITLNGLGELRGATSYPDAALDADTISIDKARQNAIAAVIEECTFADESRMEVISEKEYKDEYFEGYKFELKYTSLEPTIRDYSFIADVSIDMYSGKYCSMGVDYIEDGLDLISKEEATEKAKEYIVAEYDLDPDKLVYKDFSVLWGFILEFQVNFDYEDGKSYGASMLADTGERDGVGWGGP